MEGEADVCKDEWRCVKTNMSKKRTALTHLSICSDNKPRRPEFRLGEARREMGSRLKIILVAVMPIDRMLHTSPATSGRLSLEPNCDFPPSISFDTPGP